MTWFQHFHGKFPLSAPIVIWNLTWIVILQTLARIRRGEADAPIDNKTIDLWYRYTVYQVNCRSRICLKTPLEPTCWLLKTLQLKFYYPNCHLTDPADYLTQNLKVGDRQLDSFHHTPTYHDYLPPQYDSACGAKTET